uniref:Uncharacterized protein n=1 Tax=Alexandrium andersonii TaxID=327968 RepID=A0A7S2IJH6_9DINO|mmetsp:Transcript_84413/g.188536  ORF Transcript_84413/g.188536 Transcript_84413/m.188536 type:complete len:380 (+) Transcript_84413:24-1163(+)
MLSRQLLPDGHHVREGAERAMLQSELRKQESLERVSRTRSSMSATHSAANLSPTAAAADFLLKSGRHRSVQPAALDATLGESTAQKLLAALDGNMGILKGRSARFEQEPLDGPVTHESLFAPPGDVFNRSFKRNLFKKKKKKAPPPPAEEVARSSSPEGGMGRHRTDSVVSLSGTGGKVKAIGGPGVPREKDPFRAWKLEVMDVNKMTMKEIKSRSFEGIKEMQADIKRDNRRFRNLWLREMDEDLLYEDRTLYTPHGMLATEVAERKYDAWKRKAYKPNDYTVQKKEAQKKLFSYYGVPMSSSEPDLKAWGRVLRESHARTPAERERVRREQEAQRRKEEEARRREQEEQRAALAQAAGGVTEKLADQKRRSSAVVQM